MTFLVEKDIIHNYNINNDGCQLFVFHYHIRKTKGRRYSESILKNKYCLS